jgi:hypothetical protein
MKPSRQSWLDRVATSSGNAVYATILLLMISGWSFVVGPLDGWHLLSFAFGSFVWAVFQLWYESRKTEAKPGTAAGRTAKS